MLDSVDPEIEANSERVWVLAEELGELNKQNFEPETIENAKQKIDESKLLKILGLPTQTKTENQMPLSNPRSAS